MVVIERPIDDKFENELSNLNDEFAEVVAKLSDLRKRGKDTSIAELLTYDFAPNLKMAKVTYEESDKLKLKKIIKDLRDELKLVEDGSEFQHATELIKEAYEHLRNGEIEEAKIAYSKITEKYKVLDKDNRRILYQACFDIRNKIQNLEKK